jgi:hypothetical protein
MAGRINAKDIPADVRAKLGLDKSTKRRRSLSADEVRSHSLRVLAVVADLTKAERARVLRHAVKVNEV